MITKNNKKQLKENKTEQTNKIFIAKFQETFKILWKLREK